jgi:peroxiredoxin
LTVQHQQFLDAGAVVIAVVRDTPEKARAYFTDHAIPFPCLVDTDNTLYDQYEVKSKLLSLGQRPALFVIDREGVVQFANLGWQQWEIPGNDEVLGVCKGIPCEATA